MELPDLDSEMGERVPLADVDTSAPGDPDYPYAGVSPPADEVYAAVEVLRGDPLDPFDAALAGLLEHIADDMHCNRAWESDNNEVFGDSGHAERPTDAWAAVLRLARAVLQTERGDDQH